MCRLSHLHPREMRVARPCREERDEIGSQSHLETESMEHWRSNSRRIKEVSLGVEPDWSDYEVVTEAELFALRSGACPEGPAFQMITKVGSSLAPV